MEKAKNTIIVTYTDGNRCVYPKDNFFHDGVEDNETIKFLCKLRCVAKVAWAHKGKIYGIREGRGYRRYNELRFSGRL